MKQHLLFPCEYTKHTHQYSSFSSFILPVFPEVKFFADFLSILSVYLQSKSAVVPGLKLSA